MPELANKKVLVVGLGGRGRAACGLLRKQGAYVVGVDGADTPSLRANTAVLKADGVDVRLGATSVPPLSFDLAVISPAVLPASPLYRDVQAQKIPMLGELELAYQLAKCLAIAITGTVTSSITSTVRPGRRRTSRRASRAARRHRASARVTAFTRPPRRHRCRRDRWLRWALRALPHGSTVSTGRPPDRRA